MAKHFNEENKNIENHVKKQKAKHKKSNIILIVLRLIFLTLLIISSVYLIKWSIDNKKNSELNKHLNQYFSVDNNGSQGITIDFDGLKTENSNFFAWLIVNGTDINYPVVHYTNNDYYLNHAFDNSVNNAGCPFADSRAKCDGTDKNLVIYAHNRRDRKYVCIIKKCFKGKLVFR